MWPNPQETTDLVTFTAKILNGTLHILCSVKSRNGKLKNATATVVDQEVATGGKKRNFAKFTGKHVLHSFYFNKVVCLGVQLY